MKLFDVHVKLINDYGSGKNHAHVGVAVTHTELGLSLRYPKTKLTVFYPNENIGEVQQWENYE